MRRWSAILRTSEIGGGRVIPVSFDSSLNVQQNEIMPSLTYNYNFISENVEGYVDNLESVKQAILIILNVERYANVIYDGYYGNDFKDLLGQPYSYCIVEIPRMVKDALLQDDRINRVDSFNFTQLSIDSLHTSFTVHTIFGQVDINVEVGV